MDMVFLDVEDVLSIHKEAIERFGGSSGIRDRGALESAVAMPMASFGGPFLHEDPVAMAAAYLFHIVKNHPFVDGNKRAALGALTVFLDMNGRTTTVDDDVLVDLTLAIAENRIGKSEATEQLRSMVGENADPDEA
jgi:death-on-curing protein